MPKFSNSEKKRIYETMLKTGKELFNEKGFYDITAEIIALKIGIAKGTFYHFFKNKEHLYMVINNNIQDTAEITNGIGAKLSLGSSTGQCI